MSGFQNLDETQSTSDISKINLTEKSKNFDITQSTGDISNVKSVPLERKKLQLNQTKKKIDNSDLRLNPPSTSYENTRKLRSDTGELFGPFIPPKRAPRKLKVTVDIETLKNRELDNFNREFGIGQNIKMPDELSSNQLISLKDAVSCIPIYNGEPGELFDFITNCEEAKDMLPPLAEANITKLIQRKCLSQPVKDSLNGEKYTTVKNLIDALKAIYTPTKTEWQLQGELGKMFQKENETVVSFTSRLRKKGQEIVESHKINNADLSEAQLTAYQAEINENIKQCFLQGLKPEIDQRMPSCASMKIAYEKAIEIERKLTAKHDLRGREQRKIDTKTPDSKPVKFITDNNSIKNLKNPLSTNDNKHNYNNSNKISNPNFQPIPGITCQICEKRGHSAKTCYTRLKNLNNPNNEPCQICEKTNHTAKNCYLLNKNPVQGRGQSSTTNEGQICRYCKKPGHILKNCRILAAKNSGNPNTSFQSGATKDGFAQRPITTVQEMESNDDSQ